MAVVYSTAPWLNAIHIYLFSSMLMSNSCHIRSVEIVVELGIFVFFSFSAEKNLQLNFAFWDTRDKASKLNKSDLYSLDLISVQLKIKRKQRFHVPSNFNTSNMS